MKAQRHLKILDVIKNKSIDTQEELLKELKLSGFNTTQATVSRDINELGLIKTLSPDGAYRYSSGIKNDSVAAAAGSLIFSSIKSIDAAGNLIVIKTTAGHAQAVCVRLDTNDLDSVAGTIAGDDTIFIAVKSASKINTVIGEIKKLI